MSKKSTRITRILIPVVLVIAGAVAGYTIPSLRERVTSVSQRIVGFVRPDAAVPKNEEKEPAGHDDHAGHDHAGHSEQN